MKGKETASASSFPFIPPTGTAKKENVEKVEIKKIFFRQNLDQDITCCCFFL